MHAQLYLYLGRIVLDSCRRGSTPRSRSRVLALEVETAAAATASGARLARQAPRPMRLAYRRTSRGYSIYLWDGRNLRWTMMNCRFSRSAEACLTSRLAMTVCCCSWRRLGSQCFPWSRNGIENHKVDGIW